MILGSVLFGLFLVGALSIVAVQIVRSTKNAQTWTSDTVEIGRQVIRYNCQTGPDAVRLKRAMGLAVSALNACWSDEYLAFILNGVNITVMPVSQWVQPSTGRKVAGEAYPPTKAVAVDTGLTSLAHELAHIVEAGVSRMMPRVEHEGWAEAGIFRAIEVYATNLLGLEKKV